MLKTYRDKKYLDSLKESRCAISGLLTSDRETIDPAHIGRDGGGMGKQTHDYDCLPIIHHLHADQHRVGEFAFWTGVAARPGFLMSFVKAYARIRYLRWLMEVETDRELVEQIKATKEAGRSRLRLV